MKIYTFCDLNFVLVAVKDFSDGLAVVVLKANSRMDDWGYIDKTDSVVIPKRASQYV